MEKFLIDFKGKKMPAVKSGVGKYYFLLPKRVDKQNRPFIEYIAREKDAWTLTSSIKGDSEYYFKLWLRDDKTVLWTNDMTKAVKISKTPFNPYVKSDSKLYSLTETIYNVAQEMYNHERKNIPTDKINSVRDMYLKSLIKLLGYQSVDRVKYGTNMCDPQFLLRDVGRKLEEYRNLAPFVYREMTDSGEVVECTTVTTDEDKSKLISGWSDVSKDVDDATSTLEFRFAELDRRRGVMSSYCRNMGRNVTEEDFKIYMSVVEKTAKLIMGLNYDLLEDADKTVVKDLTGYTGIELSDEISSLIDSKDFGRACYVEDMFVRRECEKLEGRIDEELLSERVRNALGEELKILKRTVTDEKDERTDYIKKYETSYVNPAVDIRKNARRLDDFDDEEPRY